MLLVGLLVVLGAVIWLAVIDTGQVIAESIAHPSVDGTRVGSDAAARYYTVRWSVMWLHFGSLSVLSSLIALSLSKRLNKSWLSACLIGITLLGFFVWFQINASYTAYFSSGVVSYFMGFLLPTAWTVYCVWCAGLLFTALYVVAFDQIIYTRSDKREFEALLEGMKKDEGA